MPDESCHCNPKKRRKKKQVSVRTSEGFQGNRILSVTSAGRSCEPTRIVQRKCRSLNERLKHNQRDRLDSKSTTLQVGTSSPGAVMDTCLLRNQTFFEVYWAHVRVTRNQPRVPGCPQMFHHRSHQCLMPRGPAFSMPEVHRDDTQTSSYINPCSGQFLPRCLGLTQPLPLLYQRVLPNCCQPPQKLLPDVCLRSLLRAFSSTILAASAANLHPCFGFFVELLLHLFFPHSVLESEEDIEGASVPSRVLLSAPRRPIQQGTCHPFRFLQHFLSVYLLFLCVDLIGKALSNSAP